MTVALRRCLRRAPTPRTSDDFGKLLPKRDRIEAPVDFRWIERLSKTGKPVPGNNQAELE